MTRGFKVDGGRVSYADYDLASKFYDDISDNGDERAVLTAVAVHGLTMAAFQHLDERQGYYRNPYGRGFSALRRLRNGSQVEDWLDPRTGEVVPKGDLFDVLDGNRR
ncbi:MAG: hypothetical protein ACXVGB_00220 [Mycobacteriaceae bacterium]